MYKHTVDRLNNPAQPVWEAKHQEKIMKTLIISLNKIPKVITIILNTSLMMVSMIPKMDQEQKL